MWSLCILIVYRASLDKTFIIAGLPFLQNKGFTLDNLQIHYRSKTSMFFWFQVHAGWCVWVTVQWWQYWGFDLQGLCGLLESVALYFEGWQGDLRLLLLGNIRGDGSCTYFLPTEALPLTHMGLLFSLGGFFILSSVSQRASSDKVAVWVLLMSDDEKSSSKMWMEILSPAWP